MRTPTAGALLLSLLAGCGYEAPLRPDSPTIQNVIAGTVVAYAPVDESNDDPDDDLAPTALIVFDVDNPGPPRGTGTPASFSVVSPALFTGSNEEGWGAPFVVTQLDDGDYLIDALWDSDWNFSPALEAMGLAGATCGDWGGTHYARHDSAEPGSVSVEGGTYNPGVSVVVDTEFTTERPAFTVPGNQATMKWAVPDADPMFGIQQYTLNATAIHTRYDPGKKPLNPDEFPEGYLLDLEGPCAPDAADPAYCDVAALACDTAFWLLYVDKQCRIDTDGVVTYELCEGGDGFVDPHPDYDPALGIYDIWPRVFLQYLGPADGTVDEFGFPGFTDPGLPEGEYWAGENFPLLVETSFSQIKAPMNVPTALPSLSVTWAPAVAHFYPSWEGNPPCDPPMPAEDDPAFLEECRQTIDVRADDTVAADMPKGVWSITVIAHTGQIWTLPNEISRLGLPSTNDAFDPMTQGGFLLTQ